MQDASKYTAGARGSINDEPESAGGGSDKKREHA